MDTPTPPLLPTTPPVVATSLGARLMNVFVVPGEVFDEVKAGPPKTGNWLVPVLLSCGAAVVFSLVVFSQDRIVYSIREAQQKQMQKQVEAGKLKKEQAEMVSNAMERFLSPTLLKISGAVGGIAASFGQLFLVALVFWLVGAKVFKAEFGYVQAMEACGLAGMIGVLGTIITMFLIVIMGNLQASAGPVLLIREPDMGNVLHRALAAVNVMMLWYVGVVAVGLSRLSNAPLGKAAVWVYGLWVVITLALVLPGWGR